MTNLEFIQKSNDSLEIAHVFCNAIEAFFSDKDVDGCDICPAREKCSHGHNAIQAYLMMEHR